MDLQLKGKTAFISGSTNGIGLAIAKKLLEEGANIIVNGRSKETTEKAVAELKSAGHGGSVSGLSADFSKVNEVTDLIGKLPDIDILINNVGIYEPRAFVEITDQEWLRFFEINVMSGIRLSRHVFPRLLAKNWGRIIFISSESGVFIPDEMIHYGMTKTAQIAVSRGLAELTKNTNVTVNSILPGPTKSAGVLNFIDDLAKSENISPAEAESNFFKNTRPTSLIQRFASVEEVANTVAYYSSPLSSATNGAAIRVEGGLVRSIV